jgi:ABC-type phosphate transport system substrate-binding protein
MKRPAFLVPILLIPAVLISCGLNRTEKNLSSVPASSSVRTSSAPAAGSSSAEKTGSSSAASAAGTAAGSGTDAKTGSTGTSGSAAAKQFRFTRNNFPKVDGSTSLVPLAQAVASVMLGESRESVSDLINFSKTTQSYRNLLAGKCDVLIVSEPNPAVYQEMNKAGFQYEETVIANDALVFMVNEKNPVNSLTAEQLKDIYSGKIKNWSEVGGEDIEIMPFQRNEGAGSQVLMKSLVMKDTPLMEAPVSLVAGEMGELMKAVKNFDNTSQAIGYSVYYYANDMKMARGLKIISVDGIEPNDDTIREHRYPFISRYYSVIPAKASAGSPSRILYDWLSSAEGQALILKEGYVPAKK